MAAIPNKTLPKPTSDNKRMSFARLHEDSRDCRSMSRPTSYKIWKISRYARFIYNSSDKSELSGTWKIYENKDGQIELHLKDNQLIVTQEDLILESYCLKTAADTIKVLTKTDSALIFCRINNECRRFRLQFESTPDAASTQNCSEFLSAIQRFVNFKSMEANSESGNSEADQNKECLQGETTLSNIVKALTKPRETNLPLAYNYAHIADDGLPALVRMFLTDSSFPAFVAKVEHELNVIMQ